ncbi:bifunctional isocitrate dehydrogenase kinase/phosphatase [Paraferrimonas haliotis]|uniref:Isocitrate dehydrogenase kinase/phosphatase n=1 Tax=Paraferrimonas haliotis TaxID=2013866 RepID=A0AA37TMP0_9GAMM|nr:bifunctional isocitrate dehydrogenase kinase/phosphatase [Paraferrimonas haliotis]GLS82538.1 isocitrate dehydrogenase kinase/phosphatase [Paraferrimonas haliotis]
MSQVLPDKLAYRILLGFEKHFRLFMRNTRGASERFSQAQWQQAQTAQRARINQYSLIVSQTSGELIQWLEKPVISTELWQLTKCAYSRLLQQHPQAELAQTFFNSVFARLFRHKQLDNTYLYVSDTPPKSSFDLQSQFIKFDVGRQLKQTLLRHLNHMPWYSAQNWQHGLNMAADELLQLGLEHECHTLKLINTCFYRNKGAYIIGALRNDDGFVLPIALAFAHKEGAIVLDALVVGQDNLSLVFSFARSYFMVETENPGALVAALQKLMPNKSLAELYASIGFQKHGKTELYRDFINHLDNSDEQLVCADGIKGMVMTVFTLPSYPVVFKVIKDKFAPPKDANKALVVDKYALVKRHDRVGRMADTHRFSRLSLPRNRFSQALLDELSEHAPSELVISDNKVVIEHCYVERRLTPLNLFIESASNQALELVIQEYGQALKDMIAANIFPGDMLFKNFGVSRHGRVIFYDYDEVCYLHECNFRDIPPARYPEDEMAAEPWYSVAPNDVFPEEFARFLLTDPRVRRIFLKHHQDLLSARYWKKQQQKVAQGIQADVYPYPNSCKIR